MVEKNIIRIIPRVQNYIMCVCVCVCVCVCWKPRMRERR
jgi:hypothetical protein